MTGIFSCHFVVIATVFEGFRNTSSYSHVVLRSQALAGEYLRETTGTWLRTNEKTIVVDPSFMGGARKGRGRITRPQRINGCIPAVS